MERDMYYETKRDRNSHLISWRELRMDDGEKRIQDGAKRSIWVEYADGNVISQSIQGHENVKNGDFY